MTKSKQKKQICSTKVLLVLVNLSESSLPLSKNSGLKKKLKIKINFIHIWPLFIQKKYSYNFFLLKCPGKIEGNLKKFPKNTQKIRDFPRKILIAFSEFSDFSSSFGDFSSEIILFIFDLFWITFNFSLHLNQNHIQYCDKVSSGQSDIFQS